MFSRLKNIIEKIKDLNTTVENYRKDTVIQSLPSLTYVNRAKKLINQKKYEEAEQILLQALELPQKDALVYRYLASVYEKQAKFDLAVENYQISADLNPIDKLIWLRLGFALMSLGKYENAEKSFENAHKMNNNSTDVFTGWGMALMKQQKFSEAHEKFQLAVKSNKYNFSALFLSAVMEIKLKMYNKAEMKLIFLTSVSPNESNLYELAKLKSIKDDFDNAIIYAQKSLEHNPNMLPAYTLLGSLYAYKNDKVNSLKYFHLAEEKELTNPNFYMEWGKVLIRFDENHEAKEKLLKALNDNEEDISILAYLGLCCILLNEFDEGMTYIEKVTEKEPENEIVKKAFAIMNYEKNETDEAISYFKANEDDDFRNCYYLAKCYEKKKFASKVKDYYETSLRLNPLSAKVCIDYSKYLISQNDFADAQRKLRKTLKFNDSNITMLNLLFYCSYVLVKDNLYEYNIKEAIEIAEKIENINPDLFEYPNEKAELIQLLQNMKEK